MNLRVLPLAMLEPLIDHTNPSNCLDNLAKVFDECSTGSMLSKHWIYNFICPLFSMLLIISTEHEGDFFCIFVHATRRYHIFSLLVTLIMHVIEYVI